MCVKHIEKPSKHFWREREREREREKGRPHSERGVLVSSRARVCASVCVCACVSALVFSFMSASGRKKNSGFLSLSLSPCVFAACVCEFSWAEKVKEETPHVCARHNQIVSLSLLCV